MAAPATETPLAPRPASPARRGYFAAIMFFLLLSLLLSLPWLNGTVTIPWDAKADSYSQLQFLAQAISGGDSPLWTPNIFAGSPQAADPQSLVFTLPYLLLAAIDSNPDFRAADGIVFLMLFLAGTAMILYFRDRAWHPAAALVAALGFAFGGSAAWRIQHVGEVFSLCWMVISLLFLSRTLERRSFGYALLAGMSGAMMVIGRDQIAFLGTLVLAGYGIVYVLLGPRAFLARLRLLPLLVVGLVVAALLSCVPIGLTVLLAEQSNRSAIDFAGAAQGSLHPAAFLTALVANLYGTNGPMTDFWGPPSTLVWGENNFILARNMGDVYFGALPVIGLVWFGLLRLKLLAPAVLYLTIAAILLLLYALGSFTPFFAAIYALPGVDLFRRPADATFPLCALLALLGGYCLHRALGMPPDAKRAPRWRGSADMFMVVILFGLAVAIAFDKGRLGQALPALGTGAFSFALAGSALAFVKRFHAGRVIIPLIVFGLAMGLDLALNNGPNESTGLPPETYDVLRPDTQNATIALLKSRLAAAAAPDRRYRVELAGIGYEWPNAALVHDFDDDLGFNPVRLKLYVDATAAEDQVAVPSQRQFSPLFPSYRSTLANLLGLRFIATGVPAEVIDPKLQPGDLTPIARTDDAFIYENPHALPRVLLATHAQQADFDALLKSGDWPDVDYTQTVLLQSVPAVAPVAAAAPAAMPIANVAPTTSGSVKIASYRNTEVRIEADAPQGGYVVLNDVWQNWWTVEVDGKPAPMLRANVIFRAVAISPGTHEIRFSFHPFAALMQEASTLMARLKV